VMPNPFGGPIEAPPQPVETGGFVEESQDSESVEGELPGSMQPSTMDEAARFEAGLDRVADEGILAGVIFEERRRGLARGQAAEAEVRRQAANELQPWDNDPIVEETQDSRLKTQETQQLMERGAEPGPASVTGAGSSPAVAAPSAVEVLRERNA